MVRKSSNCPNTAYGSVRSQPRPSLYMGDGWKTNELTAKNGTSSNTTSIFRPKLPHLKIYVFLLSTISIADWSLLSQSASGLNFNVYEINASRSVIFLSARVNDVVQLWQWSYGSYQRHWQWWGCGHQCWGRCGHCSVQYAVVRTSILRTMDEMPVQWSIEAESET